MNSPGTLNSAAITPKLPGKAAAGSSCDAGPMSPSDSNYAANFLKKRLKEADNSYSYEVNGKMPDGSLTKWHIKYDQTLEYLMYPSLNILDDDPILVEKADSSRPGSRGRSGQGSPLGKGGGAMSRSLTMDSSGTGGGIGSRARSSPGKLRGERSPVRSSPSPNRRKGGHNVIGGGSRASSPLSMGKRTDTLIDEFMSDDEGDPRTEDGGNEDEMYGVARPEVMWEVDVTAVDKLPETEFQKQRRIFQKRVDDIGEDYLRGDLRKQYEEERQRKLRQLAEETRESNFRTLKGASSKLKRNQSALSNAIDSVVPNDRFNSRRGNATGRRDSSRQTGGNMMEIMNRPEYIYKSLRNAAVKKKVLSSMDLKADDEDDETIYRRQKGGLEEILKKTDRGHVETAFEMEGLLYYRFNYDAEHEAKLRNEREKEEQRAHIRQGKEIAYSPTKQRASNMSGGSGGDEAAIEEEAQNKSEYEKLMVQVYQGTRKEPVAATLKSDLNSINLGRLRRAINQRLSSLDEDYLLDQRELHALGSPKRGKEEEEDDQDEENRAENNIITPVKAKKDKNKAKKEKGGLKYPSPLPSRNTSPSALTKSREGSPVGTPISPIRRKKIGAKDDKKKSKNTPLAHIDPFRPEDEQLGDDAPLHLIRNRDLNAYIKNMGLERYKGAAGEAFGIGTTTAVADSVDTRTGETNLVKGVGEDSSPSKKIIAEMQEQMSGGLTNKAIQEKTIGTGATEGHKSVSGSTRVAQDNLLMMQLRSGVIPQQFIRRSNALDRLDIDIRKFSIGDEQGACLGHAIAGLNSLRSLILEDNRLTSKSIPIIVRNMNTSNLIMLDISCNNAHNSGISAIASFLKSESMLSELRMNKCVIHDDDMPPICQALRNNKKTRLTVLGLNSNKLSADGAKVIAKLLSSPGCTIKELDLSWNNISTDGTMPIASALKENESLEVLRLEACSIDDKGGQALAVILRQNKTLVQLYLPGNIINGGSCFVFSKTTVEHPSMKVLDLCRNPVGEAGARSIYRRIMKKLRCMISLRKCTYFYDDKIFNYVTPSLDSPYHLDLDVGYDAAVMEELITLVMDHPSTCRFGQVTYQQTANGPSEEYKLTFVDNKVMLRGKKFQIPATGMLTVEFFSSVTMPSMKNKASNWQIDLIMIILNGLRVQKYEDDYMDYIRLMTADLYFTCEQVRDLIQRFIEVGIIGSGDIRPTDILACTWTHLIDTRNMHDFMVKTIPKQLRRSLINEVTIDEYRFNWTNPTGHWRLNLGMRRQLFVMMKLVAINKVESDFSKDFSQSGREDTSQEGTWYNFRNAQFVTPRGSKSIVIDQEFVDHLPRTGIIDFDYVSTTRPGAPHMVEQEFIELFDAPEKRPEPDLARRASVMGSDDIVPDVSASNKNSSTKKAPSVLDKYEVISDYEFYSFLESMNLSSRDRISVHDSLFPLMYLQLAVTKYWFTVKHVMMVIDCFENEMQTQANITCVFFSRIFDLGNMDILLRSLQKPAQRLILKRLGCLNVLNPLKLALDYKISMKRLDERILLTTLLEISPQEATDQIREDPKTDVSVLTFYGALHRIVAMERDDNLLFTYLETGVASNVVAWSLRRDAMKKFLVGTKPTDRALFRVVGMYREMEKNGTLSRGPIELQYMTHLKIMKKNMRKQSLQHTSQKSVEAMRQISSAKSVAGAGVNAALALASHQLSEDQEGVTVQPRLIGDMHPGKTTGEAVLAAAQGTVKGVDDEDDDEEDHGHQDEHVGDDVAGHLDDHDDEALFGKDDVDEGESQNEGKDEGDDEGGKKLIIIDEESSTEGS